MLAAKAACGGERVNTAMSFKRFASWEKSSPPFLFSYIVILKVSCPVVTNSSF